ncbi:MAG: hypothetical protein Kow0059_14110 [Candidatus Sumerlaeia bacterium]
MTTPVLKSAASTAPIESATRAVRRTRRRTRLRAAALAAALLAFAVQAAYFWGFLVDDAYIGLRVARNVAQGCNFVYNPGEYVEGYTNFLWVAMLALVQALIGVGRDATTWAKVLGAMAGVWIVIESARLGPALGGRGRWRGHVLAVVLPLLQVSNTALVAWSVSGMETALAAALVFAGFASLVRGQGRRMRAGLFLLALGALARFDHVIFWVLAMVFCALWRVTCDGGRRGLGAWMREAWPAAALYGLYSLWRLFTYTDFPFIEHLSDLQPNTAVAKTGHVWLSHHFWKLYVIIFGFVAFGPLVLVRAAAAAARSRLFGPPLGAVMTAGYLMYLYWYGADWMPGFRLFRSVEPLLAALTAEALLWAGTGAARAAAAAWRAPGGRRSVLLRVGRWGLVPAGAGWLALGVHLCLFVSLNVLPPERPGTIRWPWLLDSVSRRGILSAFAMNAELLRGLRADSRTLGTFLEPHHLVYTDLGGAPAYYTQARILECFGLTNRVIAREGRREDMKAVFGQWFLAKFHPAFVAGVQPDYFLISQLSTPERVPADFLPNAVAGWALLGRYAALGPKYYRVGYLRSPERPDRYVYFLERRGVRRGAFRGAALGIELHYEDEPPGNGQRNRQ